mmetsp:Transcript_3090/g.10771  ORF Transcript_3090/g.10771 Transcript_3090/m.10771 type:complete len:229 (+) Transcript_3090:2349-3035(+)
MPWIVPCAAVATTRLPQSPTKTLNNGPPKHAAIAVFGNPRLAIAMSDARSDTLIPQANTVAPSNDSLTPNTLPSAPNNPTSSPAVKSIHITDCAKVTVVRIKSRRNDQAGDKPPPSPDPDPTTTEGHSVYTSTDPKPPHARPKATPPPVTTPSLRNRATDAKNRGAVTGKIEIAHREREPNGTPTSGIVAVSANKMGAFATSESFFKSPFVFVGEPCRASIAVTSTRI